MRNSAQARKDMYRLTTYPNHLTDNGFSNPVAKRVKQSPIASQPTSIFIFARFKMLFIQNRVQMSLNPPYLDESTILEDPWSNPVDTTVHNSDDDDANSVSSHSTNATVDDNPGTGRLIDKYLYQREGRRLEYFIFRIRLPSLPPARISRFIEDQYGAFLLLRYEDDIGVPLSDLPTLICFDSRGSTTLSGMKSLVQQTR